MPNQGPRAPVKATVRHLPVMNLAFPEVTWPLLTAARVVNSPPPLAARRAPSPVRPPTPDVRVRSPVVRAPAAAWTGGGRVGASASGHREPRGARSERRDQRARGARFGAPLRSRGLGRAGANRPERAGGSRLRVRGACGGLAEPIGPAVRRLGPGNGVVDPETGSGALTASWSADQDVRWRVRKL